MGLSDLADIKMNAVYRARTGRRDRIAFDIPEAYRDHVWQMVWYLEKDRGIYQYRMIMGRPRKPRTTGHRSQNHAINGYIQQIAMDTGQPFDDIKMICKERAIDMGYPYRTRMDGAVVPLSETEIDTVAAAILIEAVRMLAAELEITLRETVDESESVLG